MRMKFQTKTSDNSNDGFVNDFHMVGTDMRSLCS